MGKRPIALCHTGPCKSAKLVAFTQQTRSDLRKGEVRGHFPPEKGNPVTFRGPHSTYQKVVEGKCPPSFSSFQMDRLLEHSFLEHFCLDDQFFVIQGKFYMRRLSNTSFGRTLLGSDFRGLLLKQPFCRHFVAFPTFQNPPSVENARTSHRAFRALRAQSHEKVRKESHPPFWPPGDQKVRKESKKVKNESKRPRFDSFLTFWPPAAGRPEGLFSDFFVTSGPKGPKGSVARPRVLNPSENHLSSGTRKRARTQTFEFGYFPVGWGSST